MTPYDKQYIEECLASVKEDINSILALCSGRQKFSPGDKEQVRHEYDNLKSSLRALAIHAFESEEGRRFSEYSGQGIATHLSAKTNDSPAEFASTLREAAAEVSYRLDRLSKWNVAV